MLRKLFVDFVIVFAVCLVVWGSVPVMIVATDILIPSDELPEGTVTSKAGITNCCRGYWLNKQGNPCGPHNQNTLLFCVQRVDCSYTRNSYWFGLWEVSISCSCKDWVQLVPRMQTEKTTEKETITIYYYVPLGCTCG
jgi:hypothetical protein